MTIAYLNLRIGLLYLHQTSFEAAGDALFRGELDPRILISLWDEWRDVVRHASITSSSPSLSQSDQKRGGKKKGDELPTQVEVEIFSGLEPQLCELRKTTIGEIGTIATSSLLQIYLTTILLMPLTIRIVITLHYIVPHCVIIASCPITLNRPQSVKILNKSKLTNSRVLPSQELFAASQTVNCSFIHRARTPHHSGMERTRNAEEILEKMEGTARI
jgi:hypothetical protein